MSSLQWRNPDGQQVRVDNTWDVDTMIDSFLSLVKKSYGTTISPSEIVLADVYRNSIHKIVNGAQPVSGIKQAGSVADNLFAFQICPSGGLFFFFPSLLLN